MDNRSNFNFTQTQEAPSGTIAKAFMANVFSWMFLALTVTAATAYLFGTNLALLQLLFNESGRGLSPLGYFVIFSPIAFILVINFGMARLSLPIIVLLFMLFSVCMGMSMSFIFVQYVHAFIFQTFFITAGAFGCMALLGYTTKTDLTRMGSILYMALFGVIIASIVMMFTGGDSFLIDLICVVIFTGLTAFKVQMLKNLGEQAGLEGTEGKKLAVWGAMSLYLTFINLFMTLLRVFGGRR
jgi:FtsH-binding integral membrane protein